MKITEAQAGAIQRLRTAGYEAGAVLDLRALFLANTRADIGMRRALLNLAEQGKGFRRQERPGGLCVWVVLPELYAALDAHDARPRK